MVDKLEKITNTQKRKNSSFPRKRFLYYLYNIFKIKEEIIKRANDKEEEFVNEDEVEWN